MHGLLIYLVETSRSMLVLLSLYFTQWQCWRVVDPTRRVKDLWLDWKLLVVKVDAAGLWLDSNEEQVCLGVWRREEGKELSNVWRREGRQEVSTVSCLLLELQKSPWNVKCNLGYGKGFYMVYLLLGPPPLIFILLKGFLGDTFLSHWPTRSRPPAPL